jgi:hypothetical protein
MSCTRLSLLTKVTRDPADTVTARGETPLAVMVMVVVPPGDGGGEGDGDGEGDGEGDVGPSLPPPHAAADARRHSVADAASTVRLRIRKTSSRC